MYAAEEAAAEEMAAETPGPEGSALAPPDLPPLPPTFKAAPMVNPAPQLTEEQEESIAAMEQVMAAPPSLPQMAPLPPPTPSQGQRGNPGNPGRTTGAPSIPKPNVGEL